MCVSVQTAVKQLIEFFHTFLEDVKKIELFTHCWFHEIIKHFSIYVLKYVWIMAVMIF